MPNKIVTLFFITLFSLNGYALVPLESLTLGDFSKEIIQLQTNPLNNIYEVQERKSRVQFKRQLSIYRGLIEEGENLSNYCKVNFTTHYSHPWDRDVVKRSFLATLQYIGLDITSMALPEYAKYFNFSREEYQNLIDYLVGGYCSDNISIISKTQLNKSMMAEYDKSLSYSLPTLSNNPLFPVKFKNLFKEEDVLKREFASTINIFKSFCSWGADTVDLRLLTPFAKNPILMSYIISHIEGYELKWDSVSNLVSRVSKKDTIKVLCNDLICRKEDNATFYKRIPRMMGTQNIEEDLKRLYCEDFMFTDFKILHQPPKVKEIMTKFSSFDFSLMVGHLNSLISGIPEFLNWVEKPHELFEYIRYSIDDLWDTWAQNDVENVKRQFYYEEPLTIELIDYKLASGDSEIKVAFDVNLGEYDRANQKIGKLEVSFNIDLDFSFTLYLKELYKRFLPSEEDKRKEAFHALTLHLKDQVREDRNKFKIPPWKGPLERLIAKDIINQLLNYQGDLKKIKKINNRISIPIEINYAPFALKYIRYKNRMNKSIEIFEENELLGKTKN